MKQYSFHNTFVLRTPLKSVKLNLSQDDMETLFQEPQINEALYIASPSLHHNVTKLYKNEIKKKKDIDKVKTALFNYLNRLHTRPTPFGLFAGLSTGVFKKATELSLKEGKVEKHTRLDMEFLAQIALAIQNNPQIRKHLLFYPNSSAYHKGKHLRYVEYDIKGGRRKYTLSSAEADEFLLVVFNESRQGANLKDLSNSMIQIDDNLTRQDTLDYLNELIDSQILVSELEPILTGKEYFYHIKRVVDSIPDKEECTLEIADKLRSIEDKILNLNSSGSSAFEYSELIQSICSFFKIKFDQEKKIQIDSYKTSNTPLILDNDIKNKIKEVLCHLYQNHYPNLGKSNLDRFIEAYKKRYGGKEMPLTEVLDAESGLGYPVHKKRKNYSYLLEGIDLNMAQKSQNPPLNWDDSQSRLFDAIQRVRRSAKEIELDLATLKTKPHGGRKRELADSISVLFSLVSTDGTDQKILLHSVGGRSAVNLIGRFAHSNKDIDSLVHQIIERTEKPMEPDFLAAEIVHLPETRLGNVTSHPKFREYEMPYLAQSSVEIDKRIPIDDLMISVNSMNEVILRSNRINKVIRPKLSNAHNYSYNTLPIYHFLCELQSQSNLMGISFNYGSCAVLSKFLPRVVWNNIILERATWQFQRKDFEILLSSDLGKITAWRKDWKIPEHVVLIKGDNELFVNFSIPMYVNALIDSVKNKSRIVLKEYLFVHENPVKDEKEGHYANEMVAILIKKVDLSSKSHSKIRTKAKKDVQSVFLPGSEWVYFKIYCGEKIANSFLERGFKAEIRKLQSKGLIANWFFIRYYDPDHHLRVRMKLSSPDYFVDIIKSLNNILETEIKNNIIQSFELAAYKREIERYGSHTIEISEELFGTESDLVLDILPELQDERTAWIYSIYLVDQLLNSFEFNLERKIKILKDCKQFYLIRYNVQKSSRKMLDDKFRLLRSEIAEVLENMKVANSDISIAYSSKIAKKILVVEKQGKLEVELDDLVKSHIHMLLNRILSSNFNEQELVIYYLMEKYYSSLKARLKYSS